jgi:membrane AbrB-like protein
MTDTIVVLAIGALGGVVGRALRIPGGSMLGAMAAVGTVQLMATTPLEIGTEWATLGQLLVGAVIGSTLDRRMIRSFRAVLLPGMFAVLTMVLSGVLIGVSFALLGLVDPLTALFGMAPGGFSEMTAAAIALGASGPLVASMHLVRTTTVLVLLPLILRPMARRAVEGEPDADEPTIGGTTQ